MGKGRWIAELGKRLNRGNLPGALGRSPSVPTSGTCDAKYTRHLRIPCRVGEFGRGYEVLPLHRILWRANPIDNHPPHSAKRQEGGKGESKIESWTEPFV